MARTWMIVSQPFLRRLVFAKVDLTQQQFEHTQLIAEQKRIPERRIAMQEEIAQVASKQYKQLARKLHTDKGGSQDRFEEIKYAEMVLSDIRHTEKGGKTGPNLLVEYINMNDHDAFDSMLQRINMVREIKLAPRISVCIVHAKGKLVWLGKRYNMLKRIFHWCTTFFSVLQEI